MRLTILAEPVAGEVRGVLSGLADGVRLTVSRGSTTVKKVDCDYEALACSVDGVDAGTGYQLVAEVLSAGVVFCRGSADRLEVKADELTPVQVVLRPAYTNDTYPPAPVTDLAASVSAGAIVLAWTASGDDARAGRASEYRIFWADRRTSLACGWWTRPRMPLSCPTWRLPRCPEEGEADMKALARSRFCLAAILALTCIPGSALSQATGAAVRLQSSHPQRNLKEGKTIRPFVALAPQKELRIEISGPLSLVLLLRGEENRAATLKLVLDGHAQSELKLELSSKVSRGVFLSVGKRDHLLSVSCDAPLLIHALSLKRKTPMAGEMVAVFREIPRPSPPAPSPAPEPSAPPPVPMAVASPEPPSLPERPAAFEAPQPPLPAEPAAIPAEPSSEAPPDGEAMTTRMLPALPPPLEPAGLSEWGLPALWHTAAAREDSGGIVSLGASLAYFQAKDFLASGDTHERLLSLLSVSGRPLAGLEVNAGVLLSSNRNRSFVPSDSLTVGDPWLGVRYGYPILKWFSADLWIQSVFPAGSGMTELAADGISTRIVFLFDFRPLPELRLHLNAGYHFDNSKRIFDYPLTAAQKFAAGVNPHDQVLLRLGGAWQFGSVAPFLEFSLDPAVGAGHLAFSDNPAFITLGVRGWPFSDHRLHLLAAVDIGLMGTGPSGPDGVSTPPYDVVLALGYSFGAEAPRIEVREVVRTERVEAPSALRRARGGDTGSGERPGAGRPRRKTRRRGAGHGRRPAAVRFAERCGDGAFHHLSLGRRAAEDHRLQGRFRRAEPGRAGHRPTRDAGGLPVGARQW